MTTVAYAMRDHAPAPDGTGGGTLAVPTHRGGCGESHHVQMDDRGHAYYECDRCAPVAIGSMYGFAPSPAGVPLTPDEVGNRELAERDAQAAQGTLLKAMTDSFMAQMSQMKVTMPEQPSLMQQLAALSAEEKAQIASMLTAGDASTARAPAAKRTTKP